MKRYFSFVVMPTMIGEFCAISLFSVVADMRCVRCERRAQSTRSARGNGKRPEHSCILPCLELSVCVPARAVGRTVADASSSARQRGGLGRAGAAPPLSSSPAASLALVWRTLPSLSPPPPPCVSSAQFQTVFACVATHVRRFATRNLVDQACIVARNDTLSHRCSLECSNASTSGGAEKIYGELAPEAPLSTQNYGLLVRSRASFRASVSCRILGTRTENRSRIAATRTNELAVAIFYCSHKLSMCACKCSRRHRDRTSIAYV
jgi:hypothetical protein